MSEISIEMATSEEVVLTVLTHLNDEKIDDAIAGFSEQFRFEDHGIGLEFTDKERLAEFFQKTRELYPGSCLHTDRTLVSGDYVIMEWTLQATLTEAFYGGLSRKFGVSLHGVSVGQVCKIRKTAIEKESRISEFSSDPLIAGVAR